MSVYIQYICHRFIYRRVYTEDFTDLTNDMVVLEISRKLAMDTLDSVMKESGCRFEDRDLSGTFARVLFSQNYSIHQHALILEVIHVIVLMV